VTLTDLDRQIRRPDDYWHKLLNGVQFRIRKDINNALIVTAEDKNAEAKFRILRQDRSVLKSSRQGSASVKRSDLSHQNGGGIIIELLSGTQ
jgi:hypothetical protein